MRWGFGRGGPARRRAGGGEAGDPPSAGRGAQAPDPAAAHSVDQTVADRAVGDRAVADPNVADRAVVDRAAVDQTAADRPDPGRPGLEWRRLPPLGPTIAARPVLVGGPLMKLPDVTGTRPLIHRPASAPTGDVPGAAAGRVGGVVVPRDAESAGRAPESGKQQAAAIPSAEPERTPLVVRRRPAARTRPASSERRGLVSVSDEFVGEPQPEEKPYASSAWLRMVQAYRPQQQADSGDEAGGLPTPAAMTPDALGFSRSEDGSTLSWSSAAAPPPRKGSSAAASSSSPDASAERPRRASLAESRRLGLGRTQPSDRGDQPSEDGPTAELLLRPVPPRNAPMPGLPGQSSTSKPADSAQPAAAPARPDVDQSPERLVAPRRLGLGAPIATPADRPTARRPDPGATVQPPLFHTAAPRRDEPEQPESAAPAPLPTLSQAPVPALTQDDQDSPMPARPAVGAPVYRASFRTRPPARAAVPGAARPETGELIHRAAPAPQETPAEPAAPPSPPAPTLDESRPEPPRFAPQDLAEALRRMHGVDVSDVPVNRGPGTGAEARSLGARAFTRDGEVFLPPDEGPVERPRTRALLAHELTHAAQQRALGPSLPPEDSAAGRALEAQALAAERGAFGHGSGHDSALTHPPLPAAAFGAAPAYRTAAQPAAAGRVQRDVEDPFDAPAGWNPFARHEPPDRTGTGFDPPPQATETQYRSPPAAAETDPELAAARDRLLELADLRLLDLDDQIALHELADGLYPRLRLRLQHELLIDRERAGRLSDYL